MKIAVTNIGQIVTGDLESPFCNGDTVIMEAGRILSVGTAGASEVESCDVVVDAAGTTAIPGLIDSHVHITFGDYTPRQKTVGYLESYIHGGVSTAITASEVHVPGRPKDVPGVKALAVAAMKCFEHYRPSGMRVHAGAVILEPGLVDGDFAELAANGIWLAKAGFGAFETPYDYVPLVEAAKKHGMITMVHTGGSSIPGSSGIWAEHLVAMQPDVSFHVNGGPVAIPDAGFPRIVHETSAAMQVCTAGNLRTTLLVADLLSRAGALDRLLIATDTPTGSGIMPLGILYTISHLVSLGRLDAGIAIAAATGNNARTFRLNSGCLQPGKDADLVLIDACSGGAHADPLDALRHGDIPAVSALFTDGVPRFVGRSRNTPAGNRAVRTVKSTIMQNFESVS